MRIGIIVYSLTGNTLYIAEKIKNKLICSHEVTLLRVNALNDESNSKYPIVLIDTPKVEEYDRIIFAAHIQAFSLAKAMKMYLTQLGDLGGKEIDCFLTQHLPHSWLGGNKGLRTMRKLIAAKGGSVTLTGIVHWSRKDRQVEAEKLVDLFSV